MLDVVEMTSGIASANGKTPLVSGNYIVPRSIWVDKPDDCIVEVFSDVIANEPTSSNTMLSMESSPAGMVYFEPLDVQHVSFKVSSYNSGNVRVILYYQDQQ